MNSVIDMSQEADAGRTSPHALFRVRDMLVDSMFATHGMHFSRSRAELGLDTGERAVRESLQGLVRLAFDSAGGSYEAPTLEVLTRAANILAERSLGWGASPDDVFEQHCCILREIGMLAH